MTQVVYPSARLAANGAVALLDTVDRGLRVCELPSGRTRWDLADEGDLSFACLSASGNAVTWAAEDGRIAIRTDAGRTGAELPIAGNRIRAIAICDAGNRVAILAAAGADDRQVTEGAELVVFPIPAHDEVQAAVEFPVFDSGFLLSNDDCSLLAATSSYTVGGERSSGAFVRDGGVLRPLWPASTAPVAHGALALYGDWLFAATADGLAGWRRTGERVTLPGTMRERMIFSPDGSHLLAYRVEEVADVTSARTRFRLVDLGSLAEVRQTDHLIEGRQGAQFVLDAGLDLIEVRVTRAGELAITALGWERAHA
jgi:hypothetical protein